MGEAAAGTMEDGKRRRDSYYYKKAVPLLGCRVCQATWVGMGAMGRCFADEVQSDMKDQRGLHSDLVINLVFRLSCVGFPSVLSFRLLNVSRLALVLPSSLHRRKQQPRVRNSLHEQAIGCLTCICLQNVFYGAHGGCCVQQLSDCGPSSHSDVDVRP